MWPGLRFALPGSAPPRPHRGESVRLPLSECLLCYTSRFSSAGSARSKEEAIYSTYLFDFTLQNYGKYDNVQKINRRIAKLGATLTQVTSTGVYHTDPVPPGGHRLAKTGPVKKAEGGALTIGCFVDRNAQEYILVVNRSFSAACVAKLALHEKILSAVEISRETGKPLAPVSVAGKTLDIPLDPGDGRMYLLSRKN